MSSNGNKIELPASIVIRDLARRSKKAQLNSSKN